MITRTRIYGPELAGGIERADEVLEAHEKNKKQMWRQQSWQEHLRRAIIHCTNALADKEDGVEMEAAHGTIRALMALTKIRESSSVVHRLCEEHAEKDLPMVQPAPEVFITSAVMGPIFPSRSVDRGIL